MYQQKVLFWCSLFYYLVNIYSIYISVLLSLQGGGLNIAYLITFFCVFGIDKVIIIIILVCGDYRGGIQFSICDILQVGFIYIFFDDEFQSHNISNSLTTKVVSRILPQIIMEFIFFFCLKDINNDDNSQSLQIATLFNFILFLVLFSCLMHVAIVYDNYKDSKYLIYSLKEKAFYFCKFFLTQLPYYLSLCTFTFYTDKFGINLSCYNIFLALFTIVGYIIYKRPSFDWYFFLFIFNLIFFNGFRLNSFDFDQFTSTYIYLSLSTYINQMIRVIILFFCSDGILNYSDNNTVLQILIYMTLVMSFLQFIFLFQENYSILFQTLIIRIRSDHDFAQANQRLRNNKFKNIYFYINDRDNENQSLNQRLIASDNLEEEILNFVELFAKCKISKSFIYIKMTSIYGLLDYFYDFKYQIITKSENLYFPFDHLIDYFRFYSYLEILKERTKNGYFLSKINTNLVQMLSFQESEYQKLNNYRCVQLQITLFDKLISPNMEYQSSQILYDLYQEY